VFAELGPLSPNQIRQLQKHFDLLIRWNKVLNLTSVRDPKEIIERHYGESLFLGQHLPSGSLRIADIGSGAGFPGIPVAILRPDCSVSLIESHQRKSVFLIEATREISNIRIIDQRAEDVKEDFDWAISRAVKHPPTLARNFAFLGGEEPPFTERFTWNRIKLPSGEHRFLWLGRST
jgi:16S rRNA (guanine(527)-N(7))-methyltransferase RsmG